MAQRLNIDIVAKDKSKQALSRVQGSLAKVNGADFNLRNAFIGLGAGLVLRSIVKTGIQIENLGVQLKALFGSAKEGRKALEIVTKFAKTTPFELENIQQGITRSQNYQYDETNNKSTQLPDVDLEKEIPNLDEKLTEQELSEEGITITDDGKILIEVN